MAGFLVIDDSLIMRKNIKSILESIGHQVVAELKNGAEIISKYKEYHPDVVSLDLVMPQVNGLEALKKLKNKYPQAKVMIVTCLGKKEKILKALNLGADYYIEKPFEIEDFVKALTSILDQNNVSQEMVDKIEINDDCDFSQEKIVLAERIDSESKKKKKKEVETRLKNELEALEDFSEKDEVGLEEKLDDISEELDRTNSLKPLKITNEAGVLEIKVNKIIDEKMIELINKIVNNFLVIESLNIAFDLKDVDFARANLEKEFEKIINKIEVMGGEVEMISSKS